jgi:hypothetical protein
MGRILVLLTFASLAATFVVIYSISNKAVQTGTIDNSNGSTQRNARATKVSQHDERKEAAIPGRASSRRKQAKPTSTEKDRTESTTTVISDKAQIEKSDDASQMTVKNDSAPVYSLNSKRSSVLRRLRKGEKVGSDVEIIDSEGRWIVVKAQEKERSGFVRDDQIERPVKNPSSRKKKKVREH